MFPLRGQYLESHTRVRPMLMDNRIIFGPSSYQSWVFLPISYLIPGSDYPYTNKPPLIHFIGDERKKWNTSDNTEEKRKPPRIHIYLKPPRIGLYLEDLQKPNVFHHNPEPVHNLSGFNSCIASLKKSNGWRSHAPLSQTINLRRLFKNI